MQGAPISSGIAASENWTPLSLGLVGFSFLASLLSLGIFPYATVLTYWRSFTLVGSVMQAQVKWVEDFVLLGYLIPVIRLWWMGTVERVLQVQWKWCWWPQVDAALSMLWMAWKSGTKIHGCTAQLSAERRDTAPKLFTQVNIHFVVSGEDLDQEIVARVTADSLEKYCSVCLMLGKGVEMTHSWEIRTE